MIRSVFFIAGELSGDRYAAGLAIALRRRLPDLEVSAIGGPHLRECGVSLFRDSSTWSAIGIAEALKRLPAIFAGQKLLKRDLRRRPVDLLMPIDFGAFNVPTAAYARRRGIPVCYVVPPGSWRPDGGKVSDRLARCADAFLTPFEPAERMLRAAGLEARWLGHPLLDFVPDPSRRDSLRSSLGLAPGAPTLAVLPGSRGQELQYLAPVLLEAAKRLGAGRPDLQIVLPRAEGLSAGRVEVLLVRAGWSALGGGEIQRFGGPAALSLVRGRAFDALTVSDAALVCSGTATLEAALAGCPMAIGYRGGGISIVEYFFRKAIVPDMIGLPNLLLGRRLCPELIQEACTPERLVEEVAPLLSDTEARSAQLDGFRALRSGLGEPGVIDRWADYIVERWGGETVQRDESRSRSGA